MRRKKVQKAHIGSFAAKQAFRPDFRTEDAVKPELLETFAYEYRGRRTEVVVETEEFTAVCPWSGLPDFARITVRYVPDAEIIELRSFKYYLQTYRQVGIFQEHLTQRLLNDLVRCCAPLEMAVTTDYNIRGGVHTVATAGYRKKKK
jgi:7-cyano-7-deazaguanine reductase